MNLVKASIMLLLQGEMVMAVAHVIPETETGTAGGQQWYSAIQKAAQQAVSSIFTTTLYPIEYPAQGDFLYVFQNVNQVFNQGTFDYISANVTPGTIAGTANLSASGGFPNAYVQIISKIAYSLSNADSATVNAAQRNAQAQAQTIVSDYQTTFGQITPTQLSAAQAAVGQFAVQTLQDYVISYVLGYLWSGQQQSSKPPLTYKQMASARNLSQLLPLMPASGNQVVSDVSLYLNMLQAANTILSNQQLGSWILAQLNGNTSTPTTANGGMSTINPNTGAILPSLQVAYGMGSASVASIQNDLNNKSRTIVIGMQTSSASGDQLNVSIQGQAGFSVGSLLRFTTSVGGSYDMSKMQGTSTNASISINYAGYSIVPMAPLAWQQATNQGWEFDDPIAQAVANGQQDITGFKFVAPVNNYNFGPFANGGNFGRLSSLLIANYPTITITYSNANFQQFKQAWQETATGNLTLFGFISLGSFSQGVYGSSYQQGADNSTFTVTFTASPQVISVSQLLQQAFVIGGAVVNPGAGAPTQPHLVEMLAKH